eukprot:m.261112 g.261112  ORF g.261112 m.261112 type:complete len:588 (-) comp15575_c0_seq2:491-2254(-)
MEKARALYDFQGNQQDGELSFSAGDEITVLSKDVGEGWWQGEVKGQQGLFPESYVDLGGASEEEDDSWDEDEFDDDDGEWEDEHGASSHPATTSHLAPPSTSGSSGSSGHKATIRKSVLRFSAFVKGGAEAYLLGNTPDITFDQRSVIQIENTSDGLAWTQPEQWYPQISVKHARSSSKLKGLKTVELYIIENAQPGVQTERRFKHFAWLHQRLVDKYSCLCVPPLPSKDYDKKFGTVQTNVYVHSLYRWIWGCYRLSHNLTRNEKALSAFGGWIGLEIHENSVSVVICSFTKAFVTYCPFLSPLPSSDETMIGKRELRLQMWINRVCRHPVLCRDVLSLKHFLICPISDKSGWKSGKRTAEKDNLVGAMFFKLIAQGVSCPAKSDEEIDNFDKFVTAMSKAVKRNLAIGQSHADKMAGQIKGEYEKIAAGIELLGKCFSQTGGQVSGDSVRLSSAFVQASEFVRQVAADYAMQPVNDFVPWMEGLKEYQGLLGQFSASITSSRSASVRVAEIDDNDAISTRERSLIRDRCDTIHVLTLCEMNHFHQQRRSDFRDLMLAFFAAQVQFHLQLQQRFQKAYEEFEKLSF